MQPKQFSPLELSTAQFSPAQYSPSQLANAYKMACLAELQALKPGNVHVFADGHGMTVHDFIESANVTADIIVRPDLTLGERIFYAAEATHNAVGQNTNLGVLLLCVPILVAAQQLAQGQNQNQNLVHALRSTLTSLTVNDAEYVSRAIVLANPGGLGQAAQYDVHETPAVDLLTMMRSAQDNDHIAWQYANSFTTITEYGLGQYANAMLKWENPAWSATALYLAFLARYPDTHVARKYGAMFAENLKHEAAAYEAMHRLAENPKLVQKKLLDWDTSLKQRGINPGTSADLTVATLLVSILR